MNNALHDSFTYNSQTNILNITDLGLDPLQTFNIINLDDAMFGTSCIVQRTVEDRKRKYIVPGFVLDKEGVIPNAWG